MVDQCQLDMAFYGARQLGSTATTLLLLFYSKSVGLCGSNLIFCTSFFYSVLPLEWDVTSVKKKINSVF